MPALFPQAMAIWWLPRIKDSLWRSIYLSLTVKQSSFTIREGLNYGVQRLLNTSYTLEFLSTELPRAKYQGDPAPNVTSTLALCGNRKRSTTTSSVPDCDMGPIHPMQTVEDWLDHQVVADSAQLRVRTVMERSTGLVAIEPRSILLRSSKKSLTWSFYRMGTTSSNPVKSPLTPSLGPLKVTPFRPGGTSLDSVEIGCEETYRRNKANQPSRFLSKYCMTGA